VVDLQLKLARRVLERLGVIGSVGAPDGADTNKAIEALQVVHEELVDRQLVRWSWSYMRSSVQQAYVRLAAAQIAPDYGQDFGADSGDAGAPMRVIFAAARNPTTGHDARPDYF